LSNISLILSLITHASSILFGVHRLRRAADRVVEQDLGRGQVALLGLGQDHGQVLLSVGMAGFHLAVSENRLRDVEAVGAQLRAPAVAEQDAEGVADVGGADGRTGRTCGVEAWRGSPLFRKRSPLSWGFRPRLPPPARPPF